MRRLMDPKALEALFEDTEVLCDKAAALGVLPDDIKRAWPNGVGFMKRVPGQAYYRMPPAGSQDTPPTAEEVFFFWEALRLFERRLQRAIDAKEGKED